MKHYKRNTKNILQLEYTTKKLGVIAAKLGIVYLILQIVFLLIPQIQNIIK